MGKLYRTASLAYYKYREITIFVLCLLVVGLIVLKLLEIVIDESPYLSLVGVFFFLTVLYAANKIRKVRL